jgi:3D (Asp-Asp-Asp) domain-containing protein
MRNCSLIVSLLGVLALGSVGNAKQNEAPENRTETRIETKLIPATVEYQFSRTVGTGRVVKGRDGVEGQLKRTYTVVFKDGKPVSKELVKEERIEPVSTLMLMGRAGYGNSRGNYVRGRVITMHASAYDPSPATIGRGATGLTKMGIPAGFGIVAVDPKQIPLGSRVFVEGYGYAIAADIGSAIKGSRIDLCFASRGTALRFGRRTVKVHVLKPR